MGELRAERNSYDEAFIDAYLKNPKAGKTAAMVEAGYTGENPSQMAYRTFNRLRIKINEEFEKRKSDFAMLGHRVIVDVAQDTDASNKDKLAAGKLLMDYGGHKPGETIDINVKIDNMQDDEIDKLIADLEKSIAQGEGKIIDGEVEVIEEPEYQPVGFAQPGDNEETEVESYDLDDEEDLNAIGELEDE